MLMTITNIIQPTAGELAARGCFGAVPALGASAVR